MGLMGLIKNLCLMALSYANPILGFFMKSAFTATENGPMGLVLDLATDFIPGASVAKDVIQIASELAPNEKGCTEAANIITPKNGVLVQCYGCGRTTYEYARWNTGYLCPKCAANTIQKKSSAAERLLVYKSNIVSYHENLRNMSSRLNKIYHERKTSKEENNAFLHEFGTALVGACSNCGSDKFSLVDMKFIEPAQGFMRAMISIGSNFSSVNATPEDIRQQPTRTEVEMHGGFNVKYHCSKCGKNLEGYYPLSLLPNLRP